MKDERYMQLMEQVGMPNSTSLLRALKQAVMESAMEERESCAKLIEPKNPPDDWTDIAKIRADCAKRIRSR